MDSSIKRRLERLELARGTMKSKTRMHFTDGKPDGIEGDIIVNHVDKNKEPLNGWHWVNDDLILSFIIE